MAFFGIAAGQAWAGDGYTAPDIEGGVPWRAVGATAICLIGLMFSALKNSRRTQEKQT